MRQIARSRGGACLSREYTNSRTKLTWQCKDGHQWEASPLNIKLGKWCPACAGTQKGTIEEMRRIAKSRGGRCLSVKYINSRAKLAWQCKKGHQWEALPSSIKQGHWCSRCAWKTK
ncbi:zinc-ribbon domain-containing protein [Acidicapsa acidisoli]